MKQSEVIFLVGHLEPVTVGTVARYAESSNDVAGRVIRNCWRQGLLTRRTVDDGTHGRPEYHYSLADVNEWYKKEVQP